MPHESLLPRAARWIASLSLVAAATAMFVAAAPLNAKDDVEAARQLFERNLDAIRRHDRPAYLACYLDADTFVRNGADGLRLGYADFAKEADSGWPDFFEALDLKLVSVTPGVVYGSYRYRVRYGTREETGVSERLFMHTKEGWRIAATTAFATPGAAPPARALVGATLITGTGAAPIPDAVVLIKGGRIECAGPRSACRVPPDVATMDLAGTWITPGLIDAHVHFSQTGWADGRPDALDFRGEYPYDQVQADLRNHPERFFRSYLCSGVTGVFDVGGYPWTTGLIARTESDAFAPHVMAAGPLLSTYDFWLNLPAERQFIYLGSSDDAKTGARCLASLGAAAIKIWFIPVQTRDFADMKRVVAAAGQEARELGKPLIVHATGLREAKAALAAGARLLVHSVEDQEVDDEFLADAKKQGTMYCPTLTVGDGYVRMFESAASGKPVAIDDPNGCVDKETLDRIARTPLLGAGKVAKADLERRKARAAAGAQFMPLNLRKVRDAGIPIAMGTDAGNPLTLHGPSVYAEMEAMQAAGLTPMEVLVAATRNAAAAMRRSADLGTIEPGKAADLLIVGADPAANIANLRLVRYVVRGGVVRNAQELRAPGR